MIDVWEHQLYLLMTKDDKIAKKKVPRLLQSRKCHFQGSVIFYIFIIRNRAYFFALTMNTCVAIAIREMLSVRSELNTKIYGKGKIKINSMYTQYEWSVSLGFWEIKTISLWDWDCDIVIVRVFRSPLFNYKRFKIK